MDITSEDVAKTGEILELLHREVSRAVIGQADAVDQTIAALVASGHVLIEGVPGLGKTLLARAMAKTMSLAYSRIQFTPDLMPSDIVGHSVLDREAHKSGGLGVLRVHKGPVFTQLLLADEINRAPAKTQSALLEVMQEYQVTLEGEAMPMARPFMVMATQNPIDTEGTYPLPEAQLDRFLFKISIGFPTQDDEVAIVRGSTEQQAGDRLPLDGVRALFEERHILSLQRLAAQVRADAQVLDYAVCLARATRQWPGLASGAGPRGAIALVRAARAAALMAGRDFITPDDVKRYALPALRHRVLLAPDAQLDGRTADELLLAAIGSVPAPRL